MQHYIILHFAPISGWGYTFWDHGPLKFRDFSLFSVKQTQNLGTCPSSLSYLHAFILISFTILYHMHIKTVCSSWWFFYAPCQSTSQCMHFVLTAKKKLDLIVKHYSLEWRGYCDISIRIQEEMFLRGCSLSRTFATFDCHDWKPHLKCPCVHDGFDIYFCFLVDVPLIKQVVNKIWRPSCKKLRAYVGFWPIFIFLQDRANFSQTDLFWHETHRSTIVLVDLRFILQK